MNETLTELTLADVFPPSPQALALIDQYRHDRFHRICRNTIGTSVLETNSKHALIIACSEDQLEKILNRIAELRLVAWYVCAALTLQIKCQGKLIFETATDLESSTNFTDWNTLGSNLNSESDENMVATLEKAPAIPQQTPEKEVQNSSTTTSEFVSLEAIARATGEDPANLFSRIMRQGGHNFAIPADKAKALLKEWHEEKAERDFQALLGRGTGGSGGSSYEELEMISSAQTDGNKSEGGNGTSGGSGAAAKRNKQRSSLQLSRNFKAPKSISADGAVKALEKALPTSSRPKRDYLLEITEGTEIGKAFVANVAAGVAESRREKAIAALNKAAQNLLDAMNKSASSGGGEGAEEGKEAAAAS